VQPADHSEHDSDHAQARASEAVEDLANAWEGDLRSSGLDPQSFALVQLASLAALDASPAAWLFHLGSPGAPQIDAPRARAALLAIAPIIGSAHAISASGRAVAAIEARRSIST